MGRSAIADFMREMTPSHSPPEGARLFLGGEVKSLVQSVPGFVQEAQGRALSCY